MMIFFQICTQHIALKKISSSHNLGSMKMNVFTSGIDLVDIKFHLGCPLVQLSKLNPDHKIEYTATAS